MKKIILLLIIIGICFGQSNAFALTVTGSSNIGDKVSVFGDVKVDQENTGNVVVIKGNADIQNNVDGNVVVLFGDATINTRVSGNVVALFGTVTLTSKAEIGGDLVSMGKINRDPAAVINGTDTIIDLENVHIGSMNFNFFVLLQLAMMVVFTFFVLLLGFPILIIWKKRFQNISAEVDFRIGKKISTGLLGYFICLVALLLLFFTLAIPLAFFLLSILMELCVSIFIGKMVLKVFNTESSIYVQFLLGLILLVFLKVVFIIMIPANGVLTGSILYFAFLFLVRALGVGILVDSSFGKRGPVQI